MSKFRNRIPHRLSRGITRGAPSGESLASGETDSDQSKCATVARLPHTTSCATSKRAGGKLLRIGTVNVGSMSRRSGEVAEMAGRRNLDFCCLQETRWKGGSARMIGGEGARFKFF